MAIAYLINSYPKTSHSFIRREIRAVERTGVEVMRIALRGWHEPPVDSEDRQEQQLTRYVLRSASRIFLAVCKRALSSPVAFVKAVMASLALARMSDRSVFHHLVYLAEACRVVELTRTAGVQHLHAHFGTNSAEVAMLARMLGGPRYSFTVHGPEEFDKPLGLHLKEKVAHAEFVVAISSFGRSQMYRWLPYEHWSKVQVVHCGLEQSFHLGLASARTNAPRLVCVGRLCEQKGQLLLLEAARELVNRGVEFELVLAGDGELRPELERQIKERDLQQHVRITGWLSGEQVREQLIAARALVLPSFAEGLPVVIMEAMALARPVVTTAVAGIPELVRHGQEGWLVPAGDCQALVSALEEALSADDRTLDQMGKAARTRVLARHCVDTEVRKLAKFFGVPA